MKYPHTQIAAWRVAGRSWRWIAAELQAPGTVHVGHPLRDLLTDDEALTRFATRLRQAHAKWVSGRRSESAWTCSDGEPEAAPGVTLYDLVAPSGPIAPGGGQVVQQWIRTEEGTTHVKYDHGYTTDALRRVWEEAKADFEQWADSDFGRPEPPDMILDTTGSLAVVNLYDAHFGMYAWGEETGSESQDINTIMTDWRRVRDELYSRLRGYDVGRVLIPLGHDLSHVNQYLAGTKAAGTRAGTMQDVDTRLAKIFSTVRKASVGLIDTFRQLGVPVDVVLVPGNHDMDENYKLGEVLHAWYRADPYVDIIYSPTTHKYYGWGRNALMLTHGVHYTRANPPLPLIFATECPADIWTASEGGAREVLSGHYHKRMSGRYIPTYDVDEERTIITRSLPGLTATDAWHYEQGYRHARAGTLLMYHRDGGMFALYEARPPRRSE